MRLLAGRQIIKDGRGSNRSTTDGDKLTQTASLENLAEPSVLANPEKRQICEWWTRYAGTNRCRRTGVEDTAMPTPQTRHAKEDFHLAINGYIPALATRGVVLAASSPAGRLSPKSRRPPGTPARLASSGGPALRCDAGSGRNA
ncbi:hypothetical protein CQ050_15220 [Achromobacter sp. MYb9]|nr:hypothetical protein CQ050_15220 [Achromobacter sp. MYb9]